MKNFIQWLAMTSVAANTFHWSLLVFRILVSIQLVYVHGWGKIGENAEIVPNPFHLPAAFNQNFDVAATVVLPFFVIFGLFTRLSVLPIIGVTITGYFLIHWGGPPHEGDSAFIYGTCHLLLLVLGPGKYSIDYLISKQKLR